MLNTFKMYVFRMRKSKLTYIILIASLLLCAVIFLTETFLPLILASSLLGEGGGEPAQQNGFVMLRSLFSTGFHTVVLSVFPIMFFAFDYSTGYIKNLVGYRTDKLRLCGANIMMVFVYILAGYIVNLIFGSVIILVFCKNVFWQDGGKFLLYLLVNFIESLCYAQIMLFIADLLKKNIGAMIICVVYGLMSSAIYMIVDLIVANQRLKDSFVTEATDFGYGIQLVSNATSGEGFMLEKYTVLGGASSLSLDSVFGDFLRSGLIALIALAVFFFLDMLAMKRRDAA